MRIMLTHPKVIFSFQANRIAMTLSLSILYRPWSPKRGFSRPWGQDGCKIHRDGNACVFPFVVDILIATQITNLNPEGFFGTSHFASFAQMLMLT